MDNFFEKDEQIVQLPDGRNLSYSEYGSPSGIPIFQFHGTPGSRIFGLDGNEVTRAGLRIICPERPGYGKSSPHANYCFFDWVNDVKTLADQIKLDRFHILGVSGGGVFALACAALMPENVISTTIISCPAPISFPSFWVGISRINKALFIVSSRYPKWLSLMCSTISVLKKNRTQTKTHEGEAFFQGGIGLETDLLILSNNWSIPLEKISIPVYLWHGECDVLASAVAAKDLAKIIPNCESYFIANEGHFIGRNPLVSKRMLERILRSPEKIIYSENN